MKRLVYSILALATLLTTASCVKELEDNHVNADGTADITLAVSLGPQTRALADGSTVDQLYAGIYEVSGDDFTWVADNAGAPASISGKAANVTFTGKITLGKSYKVVFWAQKEGAPYAIDWAKGVTTGPSVTATATGAANDESRDAFFGTYETGTVTGSIDLTGSPISLKRPFAQVNVLVPTANFVNATAAVTSSMTVAQAPTVLNLATKATSDPVDWTFSTAAIDEAAFGGYSNSHRYVAMNYVLVDQTAANARYDVTFSATSDTQVAADKQVKNAPLKPNGRTNIVGNVFDANFNITIPIIIDPEHGSDQVVTTVTVAVGQTEAEAVELTFDETNPTTSSIEVAVSHPVEVEADKPQITVEPGNVASAEWNLTTGKLDVTPLVANGSAVITLVFPAVTKTDYSAATVQIYVKVGNGSNEEPEQVAAPTFTPAAGEYTAAQSVEIACATDGASIYYTTDGTDPTAASEAYTDAIAVGETMTIKAIAVKEGWTDSEIATAAYTINIPAEQVAAPTFTPAAGEYTAAQSVEIACETDGASIYYTTDGTDPTAASEAYTDAIAVGESMTIKAIAVKEGWTDSEIASAAYTINISAEPQFTTVAGLKALLGAESATFTGTLTDAVVTFIAGTSDAVIKDATGSILYHKESGHGLLQGQTVSGDVIAEAVLYNGIPQITDLAATVSGEENAVEPEVVTLAQLAADYAAYESAYVKVVGVTSKTTTTKKGNIEVTQDATDYIVYTNVAIPVNTGDIFTAEGTVTKYNTTEELKVWKTADLTVTAAAPVLSATPAATTVAATATSVSWAISSNTDWTITPGTGVTASVTSGNGNADVTLSFAANTGSEAATYTATVSATGCDDVTITITQSAAGSSSDITDTITSALLAATSTTYTDFSNVAATSAARYAGNSAKSSSGGIQLRSKNSNSGIVSTTSGGTVKTVTITVESGSNPIDVYGNNTAYTGAGDLYATGEGANQGTKVGSLTETGTITFTDEYAYVGIRSNNGAVYITSVEIVWE